MSLDLNKLEEVEKHLSTNAYIGGEIPSDQDCQMLLKMKAAPSKESHPNLYFYYQAMCMFRPEVMKTWKPVEVKKEEVKADDDDMDLFGSEDDEEKAEAERAREERIERIAKEQMEKKKKKGVIAKSILVFDVKVYEMEQDLIELSKKVYALEVDGLIWNKEPKLVEIAFGMKKLQVGCVIEDDKVMTEDLFDLIQEFGDGEEIQSIDIVSMQKL